MKMGEFSLSVHPLIGVASKFLWQGKVLDIGCGSGENAVALARHGFSVTALDSSPVFVHSTEQLARLHRVTLKVVQRDIREFVFPVLYDAIICTGVLHFMKPEEHFLVIREMQKNTSPGGIHVVSAFLESSGKRMTGLLKEGELEKLYKGWEMIAYGEANGEVEMIAKKSLTVDNCAG